MKVVFGLIAAAAMLAGCSTSSSSPEQAMAPAAGAPPLTYDARTMTEYDAAKDAANDYCYKYENEPARYVERTIDTVRFECAPRA